ncbi:hypothetical protein CLV42_102607 [Chitinophaga ginsengisoli]|uniref:Uncharacterized protein n=1 Tax=Chitinophaga ginsengisoli TaxID=363837 RepID=A0A2P8GM51_9BACT|nr:hypothetical protein CLV42_102607 [Chitinophaga ginsengisoli]
MIVSRSVADNQAAAQSGNKYGCYGEIFKSFHVVKFISVMNVELSVCSPFKLLFSFNNDKTMPDPVMNCYLLLTPAMRFKSPNRLSYLMIS